MKKILFLSVILLGSMQAEWTDYLRGNHFSLVDNVIFADEKIAEVINRSAYEINNTFRKELPNHSELETATAKRQFDLLKGCHEFQKATSNSRYNNCTFNEESVLLIKSIAIQLDRIEKNLKEKNMEIAVDKAIFLFN